MPLTPNDVEFLHPETTKLLELWMRIRLVFAKSFSSGAVRPEQEEAYRMLKECHETGVLAGLPEW